MPLLLRSCAGIIQGFSINFYIALLPKPRKGMHKASSGEHQKKPHRQKAGEGLLFLKVLNLQHRQILLGSDGRY